ncbi:MAG: hypothetical protein AAFO07_30785 [Bacteroidota bacterium]
MDLVQTQDQGILECKRLQSDLFVIIQKFDSEPLKDHELLSKAFLATGIPLHEIHEVFEDNDKTIRMYSLIPQVDRKKINIINLFGSQGTGKSNLASFISGSDAVFHWSQNSSIKDLEEFINGWAIYKDACVHIEIEYIWSVDSLFVCILQEQYKEIRFVLVSQQIVPEKYSYCVNSWQLKPHKYA